MAKACSKIISSYSIFNFMLMLLKLDLLLLLVFCFIFISTFIIIFISILIIIIIIIIVIIILYFLIILLNLFFNLIAATLNRCGVLTATSSLLINKLSNINFITLKRDIFTRLCCILIQFCLVNIFWILIWLNCWTWRVIH